MSILIDSSVGSRELISHPPLSEIGQLDKLDSGDFCFSGNGPHGPVLVGGEVKQISDLIASRQNGRLQGLNGQVEKMLSDYPDERWLLTYGQYRCAEDGHLQCCKTIDKGNFKRDVWFYYKINGAPIKFAYVESTIISLTDIGFRHHHCQDIEQCARWICVLYNKRSKSWPEQVKMFRSMNQAGEMTEATYKRIKAGLRSDDVISPMPAPMDKVEFQIAKTAASFPQFRFERAVKVAEHFVSVKEMILAGEKDWMGIEGIGKVIAKSVTQTIKKRKDGK